MKNNDDAKLLGYGIVAVIGAVVIYNYWPLIVGALALCGAAYVYQETNRNKRN